MNSRGSFWQMSRRKHIDAARKGGKARVKKGFATISDKKKLSELSRRAVMKRWHREEAK